MNESHYRLVGLMILIATAITAGVVIAALVEAGAWLCRRIRGKK